MKPACLLICNDLAPGRRALFDDWYQHEHLAERLGVAGFRTARRYGAIDASHPWAALYELDHIGVLSSEAYRSRLSSPTTRTRAVMPLFRRMVRSGLEVAVDRGRGVGGVLDMLVLSRSVEDDTAATALINRWTHHPLFERLRLLRSPDPVNAPAADSVEAQLRTTPDAVWAAVLLLEWASASGEELPASREEGVASGLPLMEGQGGRYRLLNLRLSEPARADQSAALDFR
jgi:hypothetical protein